MNHSAIVLVTGATGAVGPRVVKTLYEAGYQIRTLSLDVSATGGLPNGVEVRVGDVTDRSAVISAMLGVEIVVHLAALLHILNPPPVLQAKYEEVNVGGTSVVVDAALKANVRRVVLFSTIAVYGKSSSASEILDEDSRVRPDTHYAQTKVAAEQIVLQAKNSNGLPIGTVLRLGAAYGSRIKGNYNTLVNALAKRKFVPIGDGGNRRSIVYDKDVARAALLAVQRPAAAGKIYNVTDGEPHRISEIIRSICDALDRKSPAFSIPVGPARFAAGIIEDGMKMLGRRSPITRSTIDKYTEDIAVSSEKIQKELGFKPEYDLRRGWKETIEEMRRLGTLPTRIVQEESNVILNEAMRSEESRT